MASDARTPPRFFVLENAMDSSHDTTFERMGGTIGGAPRCLDCGSFIGMRVWLPPRSGELMLYGMGFGDLVEAGGGDYLVTDRFVEAFRSERLTGLSDFEPMEIVRVRTRRRLPHSQSPPPYFFTTPIFGGAARMSSTPAACPAAPSSPSASPASSSATS